MLFGIAGAVGVGKSTTAEIVRLHLAAGDIATVILPTDGFLLPNTELERLGITMRKGFPESYDDAALDAVLRRLRAGERDVSVPMYSHLTYDRVPGPGRPLGPADVVIVEGVNALQPPAVDRLDLSLYLEADAEDLHDWFLARFSQLCREAEADPSTSPFYASFAGLDDEQRRHVADGAWTQINLVNLRDHIAPTRARATFVLHKNADHTVRSLHRPGG
ncbi:MAG: type pantothenate kinase [Acidimicrobiales bacterium]|nr:type pantothenate kinase [Acidimicrobiales bacterium]